MYEGFLEFSGSEIVNAERTEAYVAKLGTGVSVAEIFKTSAVHIANQEDEYESPLIDDAPWMNELDPSTLDFYGLYPLEIEGIDGTTMTSTVTEHLDDGGSHGVQRDGSRAVRVHGVLVGASREGAEAGLSWLGEAVRTSECGLSASCGFGDLRYYLTEPQVCASAWTDEEQPNPDMESFGDLVGPEFLDYRWPIALVPIAMPARILWTFGGYTEGTTFQIGAMNRLTMEQYSEGDVISLLRRNYVLNPGVTSGLGNYTYVGNGSMSWSPVVDDYAYGRVNQLMGEDVDLQSTVVAAAAAAPAGPVMVSLMLRSIDGDATVGVSAGDGSATFRVTADWQRFSFSANASGSATSVTFTSTQNFDFTNVLVEVGTLVLPYFDGSSAEDDYYLTWDGAVASSTSSRVWTGTAGFTWPDSDFRCYLRLLQGSMSNVRLTWWRRTEIPMAVQLDPFERTLHEVQCTQGPQVINRIFGGAGYFIEVDFVFVAGNPHSYSPGVSISTLPLANAAYVDPDDDIEVDDGDWLADPDALAVTTPVSAPVILDPSLRSFTSWQRYYVEIPAETVQQWGQSVPTIGINSKADTIKQVRIRFHPNPFSYAPAQVDNLNYCSEVIVSYLPNATRLVVDGITRSAVASKGGKSTLPADHLLYGASGAPITWPELSCAIPYLMTIDVPAGGTLDAFDVDLTIRRRG